MKILCQSNIIIDNLISLHANIEEKFRTYKIILYLHTGKSDQHLEETEISKRDEVRKNKKKVEMRKTKSVKVEVK